MGGNGGYKQVGGGREVFNSERERFSLGQAAARLHQGVEGIRGRLAQVNEDGRIHPQLTQKVSGVVRGVHDRVQAAGAGALITLLDPSNPHGFGHTPVKRPEQDRL